MSEFKAGCRVTGVFFGGSEPGWSRGDMQIVMENGQMEVVPWVREILPNGRIMMYNVALVEIVELAPEADDE